tara:strand:+ start:177 stop:449 length:273 start_codon:yes stop_codon:yes gene_type:complete
MIYVKKSATSSAWWRKSLSNSIEGLTVQQVALCDILWATDDPRALIRQLPANIARDAVSLMQLMLLNEIDQVVAEMPQSDLRENYQDLFG